MAKSNKFSKKDKRKNNLYKSKVKYKELNYTKTIRLG